MVTVGEGGRGGGVGREESGRPPVEMSRGEEGVAADMADKAARRGLRRRGGEEAEDEGERDEEEEEEEERDGGGEVSIQCDTSETEEVSMVPDAVR